VNTPSVTSPIVAAQHAVATNGQRLLTWLRVTQWLYGILAVLYTVGMMLTALIPGALGMGGMEGGAILALVALFVGGTMLLLVLVIGWAREWLARVRGWAALGERVDAARMQQLHDTLSRWIGFYQWMPIVTGALAAVVAVVFGSVMSGALGSLGGTGADDSVFFTVFMVLYMIFVFVPYGVVNFLILGSVRRWMSGTTDHLVGRPHGPLVPLATTVGNWFVFCQVLIGLSALWLVGSMLLFAVMPAAFMGASGNFGDSVAGLGAMAAATMIPLAVSVAVYVLLFLLLEWSKRYAHGVSRLIDGTAPEPVGVPHTTPNLPGPNV